jgi:anti-sigma regulatory factor (Ser/Thr protein kinase)
MAPTVVQLPSDLLGPSLARRSIEAFVIAHQLDDEARDAMVMVASELVTNAIIHGDVPVVLSVSFQAPELTVEVFDGDPHTESVRLRGDDDPAPGGRGLRIVASLADRWGVRPSQVGKTVWAAKQSLATV